MPDGDDPRLAVVASRILSINRHALEDGAGVREVEPAPGQRTVPLRWIEADLH